MVIIYLFISYAEKNIQFKIQASAKSLYALTTSQRAWYFTLPSAEQEQLYIATARVMWYKQLYHLTQLITNIQVKWWTYLIRYNSILCFWLMLSLSPNSQSEIRSVETTSNFVITITVWVDLWLKEGEARFQRWSFDRACNLIVSF